MGEEIDRSKVVRFPGSLTMARFFSLTILAVFIYSIFMFILSAGCIIGLCLVIGDFEMIDIFFGIIGFTILAVLFIILLLTPYNYNRSLIGNEVRLTRGGLAIGVKPQFDWPLILNQIPYNDISSVSFPMKDERPGIRHIRRLFKTFDGKDLDRGYYFHPLADPDGFLLLKFKKKLKIRTYKTGKLKKIIRARKAAFPIFEKIEDKIETDHIFIDVLPRYHDRFIGLINERIIP